MLKPGTFVKAKKGFLESVRPKNSNVFTYDIYVPKNTIIEIIAKWRTIPEYYYVWIPSLNVFIAVRSVDIAEQ